MDDADRDEGRGETREPKRKDKAPATDLFSLLLAGGVALSVFLGIWTSAGMTQLQRQADTQARYTVEMSKDVAVLKAKGSGELPEVESPPGLCLCIKERPGAQSIRPCPSKNETCDDESRAICEAQHAGYGC